MPSKKKKYNARFPAGRIKKIMQSDEEIGKVAQAVPVIISKTLELFVESLLTKTLKITNSRNAKTLSTSHMKQCIMAEQRFDFLRELVKNIPDISVAEEAANYQEEDGQSSPDPDSDTPTDLSMPSTSSQAVRAAAAVAAAQLNNGAGSVYQRSYSEGGVGVPMYHAAPRPAHRGSLKRSEPAPDAHSARRPVIMHTTNVLKATDVLPPKLWRSDSTPAEPQLAAAAAIRAGPRTPRLTEPPSHNHVSRDQTALATAPAPVAAIPAPIVSFDFCNKPVVKIDYSNLPISAAVGGATAATAGAATDRNCAAAPVVGEPVINIDLSNLCTAPPLISAAHQPSAANSSRQSKTAAAVPAISYQIDLTKSLTPAVAVTVATPPAVAVTATAGSAAKNSFLELDEDYDNI